MRRILFTALTSGVLLVAVPVTAIAKSHHHNQRKHAKLKHKRFGSDSAATPVAEQAQTAGRVASFTGGVLTITLTDGSTVSGKVTDATELQCESATTTSEMAVDEQSPGGSDNGGGANNGGDNGGDHGDQQGTPGTQGGDEQTCTTSALTTGAVVQEAELSLTGAGATWSKIDLSTP